MGRSRYKIHELGYPYFITSSIIYGLPLFGIPEIANIMLQSFQFLQEQRRVKIYAYVIMENHIHFIAQSDDSLAKRINTFKSFTARKAIDFLKLEGCNKWLQRLKEQKAVYKWDRKYQFWQEGYHPKQIIGDDMMAQKVTYIHNNPVKRGYIEKPEDWRYSSACNYVKGDGLIDIHKY